MERTSYRLEFLFRASPTVLYKCFISPDNLVRWFCDEVSIEGDIYTFIWDGYEEVAELVDDIENERIRFRWEEAENLDEYFEIKFTKSGVTKDTLLEITDFCDSDEIEDSKALWTTQIERLKTEIGG